MRNSKDSNIKKSLWIVGCGQMAIDHFRVANSEPNLDITVIGNTKKSAMNFFKKTNLMPVLGGLKKSLDLMIAPDFIIIAVDIENLFQCAFYAAKKGVKRILVEKPCSHNLKDLKMLNSISKRNNVETYIGYNRRFYRSVKKARKIIDQDNGISSLKFDFTEWDSRVKSSSSSNMAKKKWVINNSSHVIDLAIFFMGGIDSINSKIYGSKSWHPSGSIFVGYGVSNNKISFSYHADWDSAGSWSLEIMTKNRKLYLKPLEKIFEQKKDSLQLKEISLVADDSENFKEGLNGQLKSLLGDCSSLCSLEEMIENIKVYRNIAGYS